MLRTEAGDISVGAARGVSAVPGRRHRPTAASSNALRNTDGAAALTIHATTAYGDITARSL